MSSHLPPGVELAERIGEGGLADVFRGTWNGRTVALKVLRDPERPGLRKRFIREGRLLQRLSHTGLVRCFGVIEAAQPMLVLELLEGEPLDQAVRHGALGAEEGLRLAGALLRVLGYLHEQGIVHRDVKASNVWLGSDRRIVLLDLGLAADVSDPLTTTLGDVLGTHAYMAPEQIAGAETDHRVDLYSLGITLYEALSGARPYHATGLAGWLSAHRGGGAPALVERVPNVPVRLASVVDRLMARDPAVRPVSAAAALAMLTGRAGTAYELQSPPMVGREGVSGAIQAILDGGGVLRITGELGSGLGLVARHALTLARADQIEYATVRCRQRATTDDVLAALARDLETVFGPVKADLKEISDGIRTLVRQDGRFLVVVEDLDLAPDGAAELITKITELPGIGVVVLGRALPDLPKGRELELRPLDQAEVRALLARMLGTSNVPPGLDAAMLRTSGGLPALVVGMLREQVSRGAIWCEGMAEDGRPRWAWNVGAPLPPAEETTRLFDRGLRALPPASRHLVQALAVAGEPVPLDLLLEAAGSEASGIDLGAPLRTGLVAVELRNGEEWVRLRRTVLEPLLVNALDEGEAAGIHLALADAVSSRPLHEWEQRFLRLHLALGARDPDDTARLIDLGDWLVSGGRPTEALEVLDAAAGLPVDSGAPQILLALARGEALTALGRLAEARAALDAGRALAQESDSAELKRRSVFAHLELTLQLGSTVGVEPRAHAEGDRRTARARLAVGHLRLLAGDLQESEQAFEAAVSLAPPGPVDRVGVAARFGLGRLAALRGDLERAEGLYSTLAAELRTVRRPISAAEALIRGAEVATAQGRVPQVMENLRLARELVGDRPAPWIIAAAETTRAGLVLALGDPDEALEILHGCAVAADVTAPYALRRSWLATMASTREALLDTPAALAAHLRALEVVSAVPDMVHRAYHAGMVAVLTAQPAPLTEAVETLAGFDVPSLMAQLLRLGGVVGRDADVLATAEAEARRSGNLLLLLDVLHSRGLPTLRAEARSICARVTDGLFGPLASRFADGPAARWAAGERARSRRDTGG